MAHAGPSKRLTAIISPQLSVGAPTASEETEAPELKPTAQGYIDDRCQSQDTGSVELQTLRL